MKEIYYRPQRSCGQGNIFTPVCHSVHRGGVCLSYQTPPSRHPPGADTPPREQTPPGADTPQSKHPLEQTPPQSRHTPPQEQTHTPQEQTPPGADTPWSRHHPPPPGAQPFLEQTPPPGAPPPGIILQHTVYERLVRILLECILVQDIFLLTGRIS